MEKQKRNRKKGKLKKILIIALIILVSILSGIYFYLRHTLPETRGTIRVEGIHDKVEIKRNRWGVPFIEAKNIDDLFYAVGFVHAQDRLFQMEMTRRLAAGRLAEVIGEMALGSDKFHKGLLIEESVEKSMKGIKPGLKKILQSYCRGVNSFIKTQTLPPEFLLLGYEPGEWQLQDMLSVFKRMEIILAGSGSELYNMRLIKALGEERAKKFMYGVWGTSIINEDEYNKNRQASLAIMPSASQNLFEKRFRHLQKLFQMPRSGEMVRSTFYGCPRRGLGSNNWVISGSKTVSGFPILANDPHLSNVFPSYFYQVMGRAGDFEISGNTLPGVPFIIIGRNKNIGWGFTNIGTDVIDYFALNVDPNNENRYEWEGGWRDFKTIKKRIKVKDEEDYIYNIKVSHLGPGQGKHGRFFARHSIGEYETTIIEAFYKMNAAGNIDEFIEGLKKFSSPAQNVVFADREGNTGYYPTGLIPRRGKGNGELPVLATKDADTWTGFVPEEEKPYLLNPEKGYVTTANNPVLPDGLQPIFAKTWFPSFRADRIGELLEKKKKITIEDVRAMQTDSLHKSARFLVDRIKDYSFRSPEASFVHDRLTKWNFKANSGIAPFLFYRFRHYLTEHIFKDNIKDEQHRDLISTSWTYKIMDYPRGHIDEAEFAYWVDDLTTAEKEDFKEMVRRGLIDTHKEYSERAKKESPEWQKLLTLTYRHPMGSFPILKSFLDRGPYTVQGGKDCIMINSFREDGRFAVDHLSTFRMIIDFSDFSNSLLVNSSGQSGHFLSPYYDDQIELYVNRKYRKMEDFPSKGKALLLLPKTEK